jgi:hypothetical protein
LKTIFLDGFGEIGKIKHLLKICMKNVIPNLVGDALDIMKYFVCLVLKINLAYKLKPQGEVA